MWRCVERSRARKRRDTSHLQVSLPRIIYKTELMNVKNQVINLLGIERKIAQANSKYHSGWMWVGVTNGLASVKLSGSLNIKGYCKLININRIKNMIKLHDVSKVQYTLNETLLKFLLIPIGFFDPVSWKKNKCNIIGSCRSQIYHPKFYSTLVDISTNNAPGNNKARPNLGLA